MIKPIITNIKQLKESCNDFDIYAYEQGQEIIKDLEETLIHVGHGVGLAAPQIGYKFKAAIIRSSYGSIDLINPKIIDKKGRITFVEGCLSLPGIKLVTDRWNWIKFENTKNDGTTETLEAEGIYAVILQHEIGHLYGQLITDIKHGRR